MKITIEPSKPRLGEFEQHKVIVETTQDDLELHVVIELLSSALVSYGFSRKGVTEYFEETAC